MEQDWKAAFAARHRDVLVDSDADGERWRPLRQSAAVNESQPAWRWLVLGVVVLHLLLAALLSLLARPPLPAEAEMAPLIVEFIRRQQPAERPSPPEPPSAPALRPQRRLAAPPVPDLPPTEVPAQGQPTDDTALAVPSAGDLLRMLPYGAKSSNPIDGDALSRHGRTRLPGRAEAFVEGIHVRGRPSPEQRIQFVLGLVGLGKSDPCPDIQRHIRDSVLAEQNGNAVDGELEDWLTRGEGCRR